MIEVGEQIKTLQPKSFFFSFSASELTNSPSKEVAKQPEAT